MDALAAMGFGEAEARRALAEGRGPREGDGYSARLASAEKMDGGDGCSGGQGIRSVLSSASAAVVERGSGEEGGGARLAYVRKDL